MQFPPIEFYRTTTNISKNYIESQRPSIATALQKKNNEVGAIMLSNNKLYHKNILIKTSWLKKASAKWKENQPYGKIYLQMIPWTSVWFPKYIKNSHDSTPGRQITQLRNGQRTWTDTSLRTYRGPRNIYERMFSITSQQKMYIKMTMRYDFRHVRMVFINKSTNNKCWWGCGEKGTLVHCWWECRLMQPLWKQYGISSEN